VKKKIRKSKDHRILTIKFDYRYKFRIFDEEKMASIFFPHKRAKNNRVALTMIYLALECNWKNDTTIHNLEDIRQEQAPEISSQVVMSTLEIMRKSGLVKLKNRLFWQLSNRFCKVLRKFAEDLEIYNSYRETEIDKIDKKWFMFQYQKATELIEKQSDRDLYINKLWRNSQKKKELLVKIRKQSKENRKKAKEEMKYRAKLSLKALEQGDTKSNI